MLAAALLRAPFVDTTLSSRAAGPIEEIFARAARHTLLVERDVA